MAVVIPKTRRPETVSEARYWTTLEGRYVTLGLCHTCAAQAAWGHQLGWGDINPPCDSCQPIVAGFPSPTREDSPWRKHSSGLEAGAVMALEPGDTGL
jgi:hypothetical protein